MSNTKVKAKFTRLGRGGWSGEVEVSDAGDLIREAKKHLASRNIDVAWEIGGKSFKIEAGFHAVGEGALVSGVFTESGGITVG